MNLLETIDGARKVLKDKLDPSRTFPDNSSSFFEDSDMTDWYNWAQIEVQNLLIQTRENWFVTSTSITLVANQENYSLPSDCLSVTRIEDVTGGEDEPIEIRGIGLNDKDNYVKPYDSYNTVVRNYAIHGNQILFRPIPNTGYASGIKLYYSKIVDTLTSASSCSTIPNQYHELIMWGVVENGLIKQEANAEAIATVMTRRNRLIKEMMNTGELRQVQNARRVKVKKWR